MGKNYVETVSAENIARAKQKAVSKRGGMVVNVAENKSLLDLNGLKDFLFSPKLKMQTYIATLRQLAVMTNAGISIHDSVSEVAASSKDKRVAYIFARIRDDLNAGMGLSQSILQFKSEVGNVSIALISLGEQTGRLAESLDQLINILQDVWDNRQKFKKALRYPVTVIIAICAAFVILMTTVVPKFREIFESFNADLPMPTQVLLGIESALSNYGLYIGSIVVSFVFLNIYMYKHSNTYKYEFDKYILKTYLIGDIIYFSTLNRFNLVFGELVHAGIPVVDSLDVSLLNVDNAWLKERLEGVKVSVSRGNNLSVAIAATGLYENMLIQMLRAGERSGNLDTMINKVTDYYKERFNNILDNISAYVEPIMLVFIAGMVIMMALGIFMPMWELARAVK